jgi:hypothetical protein
MMGSNHCAAAPGPYRGRPCRWVHLPTQTEGVASLTREFARDLRLGVKPRVAVAHGAALSVVLDLPSLRIKVSRIQAARSSEMANQTMPRLSSKYQRTLPLGTILLPRQVYRKPSNLLPSRRGRRNARRKNSARIANR